MTDTSAANNNDAVPAAGSAGLAGIQARAWFSSRVAR